MVLWSMEIQDRTTCQGLDLGPGAWGSGKVPKAGARAWDRTPGQFTGFGQAQSRLPTIELFSEGAFYKATGDFLFWVERCSLKIQTDFQKS